MELQDKQSIWLSHRILLRPTNRQVAAFKRACGVRRFAYNWALGESRRLHQAGEKTSGYDLRVRFNAVKDIQFHWVREVSKWASEKAIYDAWDALKYWWAGRARCPVFKKRGKCKETFYLHCDSAAVDGRRLRVAKVGTVKMTQEVRFPGKLKSVTISEECGRWYAAVMIELADSYVYPHICETQEVCGIDLGLNNLMAFDSGECVAPVPVSAHHDRKIRRFNQAIARQLQGSRNRAKRIAKAGEAHRKVRMRRMAYLHKITSEVVRKYRWIGIEDLDVLAMWQRAPIALRLSNASFAEIRRQLEYKSNLARATVVVVDRFFPSSKTCSVCGHVVSRLPGGVRAWKCVVCGTDHDRDVNAARNLRDVARRQRDTKNACGEDLSPTSLATAAGLVEAGSRQALRLYERGHQTCVSSARIVSEAVRGC